MAPEQLLGYESFAWEEDVMNRLTNEVCLTNGLSGGQTNSWVYDEAGNWRAGDGRWRLYNADNELVGIAPSNAPVSIPITVTGEVAPGPNSNKWYNTRARCRGVSAPVSQTDGTFSLAEVPLYPGTNHLVVTVRDVSGNEARQVRTVSRPFPEMFHYDGNGNLTNWVCGTTNWVYEWDGADRLTKVTSNGVVVLENWYDATGWRVAKTELINGQPKKEMDVLDGFDTVCVLSGVGQMLETFTRGVGLAGDVATLVGITHHPSSATNGTFYVHNNHRGDVTLTRAETVTVNRYEYSAFGSLKGQTSNGVCRFTFLSKERDVSTGFSYYGCRFYEPDWQRWLNTDPIGERGAVNLFVFAANNPLVTIDLDGRWVTLVCCIAWAGLTAYDLYEGACVGQKGWDLIACIAQQALGAKGASELLSCLGTAFRGSVKETLENMGKCFTDCQFKGLRDAAKMVTMSCCIGGAAGKIASRWLVPARQPVRAYASR